MMHPGPSAPSSQNLPNFLSCEPRQGSAHEYPARAVDPHSLFGRCERAGLVAGFGSMASLSENG